ncbi:MAG: hypothetical protein KC419_17630, partial [Anaerolineales bacterium]|nr:hypothetical protein [Anaerolineales bacterium]
MKRLSEKMIAQMHLTGIVLLVLVIISLPYLSAWAGTPAGMTFTGALLNPDDMGVYVSAMRQGANGHRLYHFTYSPEPWQPRLMLLLYLVLGKLTAVFTTPTVFTLHIWRTLLAALSIVTLLFWVRTVFPKQVRRQWISLLLILFGSGVGWIAVFLFDNAAGWSPDLGFAEWSPLIALFNTPHFALGLGLEALFFALMLRMSRKNGAHQLWWALLAALVGLLDSLVYVYHLAIIGLVVGFLMPATAFQARRIPWRQWGYGAVVLLPQLPLLYYYAFQTNNDPYWTQYITTTHVISPPTI